MCSFLSTQSTYDTIPSQEFIEFSEEQINYAQIHKEKLYEEEVKQQNTLSVPSFSPKKQRKKSCDFKVEIPKRDFIDSPYSTENQILPGLYLGGRTSGDQVLLDNPLAIDFIVNLDHTKAYSNKAENGIEAINIPIYDDGDLSEKLLEMCSGPDFIRSDVKTWFQRIFCEIDHNLGLNKRVLIHCFAGASRSATITIAYLMSRKSLDFNTAYQIVKEKRYETDPNLGFCMLLKNYETMLQLER